MEILATVQNDYQRTPRCGLSRNRCHNWTSPYELPSRRLTASGIVSAAALKRMPDGQPARFAGFVISRQMPGSAKGFFFMSIEDETGVLRVIVDPNMFKRYESLLSHGSMLEIEGILQNQDGDISLKTFHVSRLVINDAIAA